jgi:hypothetical protein
MTQAPLQPDHGSDDTHVLLVYGWPVQLRYSSDGGFDALIQAVAPADGVVVAAQDFVNGCFEDGDKIDGVIGVAAINVCANDGPCAVALADLRAIEERMPAAFTAELRRTIEAQLGTALAGEPRWLLAPTGALATGYCAFGTPVPRYVADKPTQPGPGRELIYGCDMGQNGHDTAIDGVWVANATDWRIEELDLSDGKLAALRARAPGELYVMGRYD